MPGPPPKKGVRRRNLRPDWKVLPREGYGGPVPDWPVGMGGNAAAKRLWIDLWRTPQASAWAELGWNRVVARYALACVRAEMDEAPASLMGEVRQMEDRLGLSPMAMRRLQWEIGEAPEPPKAEAGSELASIMDSYA